MYHLQQMSLYSALGWSSKIKIKNKYNPVQFLTVLELALLSTIADQTVLL